MSSRSVASSQPRRRAAAAHAAGWSTAAPGQQAAARLFFVNAGALAVVLAGASVVLAQLLETWQVGGVHTRHLVSLLGQRVSYPAANVAAIAVAALAVLGLVVLLAAARASVRELSAQRRTRRRLRMSGAVSMPDFWVLDDDRLQAFCAGLKRPEVYVSRGALERLGAAELAAVVAHEHHHAQRRDPLRLAIARVLGEALFFLPAARGLVARQHAFAEIGADEAAVAAAGGGRAALASAMLRFADSGPDGAAGFAPERIDHLAGEGERWRVPLSLCVLFCASIAAVATFGVVVAGSAKGSATLALPLLASQPCVLALASIPVAIAAIACVGVRIRARSRS